LLGKQNAQSPFPWEQGKNTKLPAHPRQVKQPSLTHLFSAESLCFPRSRVGERALNLPKEQGKSLHSPLSKGRELHAPGWGPFLVSPISTCFKYFKSHSGHVCHFAELIYARLYLF
ncbi:hypothetical protein T4B_12564, partial [Trichinella pseudospiralis]